MHPFHWIDWAVAALPLAVVFMVGYRAQKHLKAVSDFTSGGRVAGRYVICVAAGEAGMGLISVVGLWEMYYSSGFGVAFWNGFAAIALLLMNLFGYCTYRFRETRCLTIAQFLEVRYSRGVRLYSGFVSVASGVVNYAIFPAVGARFIMYFADLPERVELFGLGFNTYGLLLAVCIGAAFAMVWLGGQLTIMCTDCTQGIFGFWMYLVIVVAVLCLMSWETIADALVTIPAPGKSLVDPFDNGQLADFNVYYIAIGIFGSVLNRLSWQGSQGYNSAAANAHEARMAGILGAWRGQFSLMMFVLLAIVGFTYMNHPEFAAHAAKINDALVARGDNPAVINQLRVPMALSNLLPVGVTGLFFASMILLMISTDNTYMHSWGTVLFQDCVLPLTRKRLAPRTHLMGLRMSALFVALFAWTFSYYFGQTSYILMFFALTATIYLGGAGPCIVGGLYWKRGTAAGAYASLTAGMVLGGLGMALSQPALWRPLARRLRDDWGWTSLEPHLRAFPVNGQWLYFIAMVTALALYVLVSLATCRTPFDLGRMLHRDAGAAAPRPRNRFRALLGITDEFSRSDRLVTGAIFGWSAVTWILFLGVIGWNVLVGAWSPRGWMRYFFVMNLVVPAAIGLVSIVWFTVGGVRGLRQLFVRIRTLRRDERDDGRVVGHVSAADLPAEGPDSTPSFSPPPGRMSRVYVAAALGLAASLALPWVTLPAAAPGGDSGGAAAKTASRRIPGFALPCTKGLSEALERALRRDRLARTEDLLEGFRLAGGKTGKARDDAEAALAAAGTRLAATYRRLAAGNAVGAAVPASDAEAEAFTPAETAAALLARAVAEPHAAEWEREKAAWRRAESGRRAAERELGDNRRQVERVTEKLRQRRADAAAAVGGPADAAWPAAWAIWAGPALALAGLWANARGRPRRAARLGIAAALATAAVMGSGMLTLPETLGGFIGPGVLAAMTAAFLLLASSAMALVGIREAEAAERGNGQ